MAKIYDLLRWLRDYVGDPHQRPNLMADEPSWYRLCVALDTIEDTESAALAYVDGEFPSITGEKYLRSYGILQVLFVQQDALVELVGAVRPVNTIKPRNVLTPTLYNVREVRNMSVGHPVKLGRKPPFSTHVIVQNSMSKQDEVAKYCYRDALLTYACFCRMNFMPIPDLKNFEESCFLQLLND